MEDVVFQLVTGLFFLAIIYVIFYIFGRLLGLIYKLFVVLLIVAYPLVAIGHTSWSSYISGIRKFVYFFPNLYSYVWGLYREAILAGDVVRLIGLMVATAVVLVPFTLGFIDSWKSLLSSS
jgi:hypothetical protein